MAFGSGAYTYEVEEGWYKLPEGWSFGWIPAVAVDSQDRVYVYSRSEHPMVVFDREGHFLTSWGEDVLDDAHGLYIDQEDMIYCVERNTHCLKKFSTEGELLMTVGTPNQEGAEGEPFRLPTDVAFDSQGFMYISDGYGNARMHKYAPDGEWIKSWGQPGTGPGEFDLVHSVRVDKDDRLWVCDRSNNRVQFFDTEGNFQGEWTGLHHPDNIYIDDEAGVVYVAELDQRVSIWTTDGEKLSEWGRGEKSDVPGEFKACPHGIWIDSHNDLYVGQVQTDGQLQKFIRQT
ncbi:MAG: peptidyl-alpha-hydroxyglycine alpha-amidating lyase family protein [bacterium]|nr:peptidyl-alpha-hydroxyglycine alpha-amidating lyase family protein [bacterium]